MLGDVCLCKITICIDFILCLLYSLVGYKQWPNTNWHDLTCFTAWFLIESKSKENTEYRIQYRIQMLFSQVTYHAQGIDDWWLGKSKHSLIHAKHTYLYLHYFMLKTHPHTPSHTHAHTHTHTHTHTQCDTTSHTRAHTHTHSHTHTQTHTHTHACFRQMANKIETLINKYLGIWYKNKYNNSSHHFR
jgi:hypothetical protein